jgi:hypothetical protein
MRPPGENEADPWWTVALGLLSGVLGGFFLRGKLVKHPLHMSHTPAANVDLSPRQPGHGVALLFKPTQRAPKHRVLCLPCSPEAARPFPHYLLLFGFHVSFSPPCAPTVGG